MNLVAFEDGALELRWTWFPYWLVVSPIMKQDIERVLRDAVLMQGVPVAGSMDAIDDLVIRIITKRFKIPGLGDYLRAMKLVKPTLR